MGRYVLQLPLAVVLVQGCVLYRLACVATAAAAMLLQLPPLAHEQQALLQLIAGALLCAV